MCGGPDSVKNSSTGFVQDLRHQNPPLMDNEFGKSKDTSFNSSILLELSANDDLIGFKQAVEEDGSAIDEASYWFGSGIGCRKMGLFQRTPLMIAALYGSTKVLEYIISAYTTCGIDINKASVSDGATALHCAAAGGLLTSHEVVKLLLGASADVSAVDLNENRPGDVVASSPKLCNSRARLEKMLNSGDGGLAAAKSHPTNKENQEVFGGLSEEQQIYQTATKDGGSEKKEYPIDLSLPDIKNGMYSTDEFRMYSFKVKPCSRAYSHDWTECPFVHPGENARRRDPRRYHYSCMPCPDFRKGACRRGDTCEYAHGVFECWLHPAQYRTRLCKDETSCTRRVCFFAHTQEELRPLYPSTGSAVLSPRSAANNLVDTSGISPLALGSPSLLMLPSFCSTTAQGSVTSTPPMSPSTSAAAYQHQIGIIPPTLNLSGSGLQGSRLKSALNARDIELEELAGFDGQQQQQQQQQHLMDGLSNFSGLTSQSSRINALAAAAALAASPRSGKFSRHNNLEELFASDLLSQMGAAGSGMGLDPSILSQLQGLSLKTAAAVAAASAAATTQYQSPTSIQQQMRQNLNQLHSSYGMPSSPVRVSSGFNVDMDRHGTGSTGSCLSPALAAAVMNSSRSAAFAKRSQSFCDRGGVSGFMNPNSSLTPGSASPNMADWGSPTGKLDWGLQGEELNKLRKSASFGFRSASAAPPEEPDVSWVQSLVKDGPSSHSRFRTGGLEMDEQLINKQEQLPPWVEQLYMEQEQMVA